ncbi:MAG: urease accessory protein UreF [Pseudomonadota bacterium]
MADPLSTLMIWLSPAYPVGAFSFSHGLETAVSRGVVQDADSAGAWIADCLTHGAGRSDAILLSHAIQDGDKGELAELAEALAPSTERRIETTEQGRAFAETTRAAWGIPLTPAAYPVVLGEAAAALEIPREAVLRAYLTAFAANLISAAIRLVPLGQTDGQILQARLAPRIEDLAREAATAPLDTLGTCTIAADIASMQHETQTVRLFRS